MNETETTYSADHLRADAIVRSVIGGESGACVVRAVEVCVDKLRSMIDGDTDHDAVERYIAEQSDPDAMFPYRYDRAQAFAESIHHVTHEPEAGWDGVDDDMGTRMGLVLHDIVRQALEQLAVELQEEWDEAHEEA